MSHKLVLDVPDEVYNPLDDAARRTGTTPEALAVAWLSAASRGVAEDPVEKFIGAIRSNVPDWAERHDEYFGKGLSQADPAPDAGNGNG
jgi:hypothetical protein